MLLEQRIRFLIFGFLLFITGLSSGQDQNLADSLKSIYQQDILEDTAQLELLRNLAFNEARDLVLALKYADELIRLSQLKGNTLYLQKGYYLKGSIKRLQGDLEEALDAYFKSSEAAKEINNLRSEGITFGAIADIYNVSKNHSNARNYYKKAIQALRQTQDSIALASIILNAGDEFLSNEIYDSALLHFQEAEIIFEKLNYLSGKAYSLGNIGMVHANIGERSLAEDNIRKAIEILQDLEDYYPICVYLISMCDIYLASEDYETALTYASRSLTLAHKYGLKEQIGDANLKLAELFDLSNQMAKAYQHYKAHIKYRDSVNNIEAVQNMANLRTDFEVSKKQIEVDLLNQQRKNQRIVTLASIIVSLLVILLALGLYRRYHFIKRTKQIIEAEKDRSETLLLNILPKETAQELKEKGHVQAKKFEAVTVLFSDFKGFTKLAEHSQPEELIRSIDFYFKEFDKIITKYGLEKIKTIGDSYMCASGLPQPNTGHAKQAVKAGREMIDLVKEVWHNDDDLIHFEIRIGIHTGPVVAGIVGMKKWQYDIWGDTVNIASRMESMSVVGKINLSESTYREIQDEFVCTYRGEIEVKNRGALKMYFLEEEL